MWLNTFDLSLIRAGDGGGGFWWPCWEGVQSNSIDKVYRVCPVMELSQRALLSIGGEWYCRGNPPSPLLYSVHLNPCLCLLFHLYYPLLSFGSLPVFPPWLSLLSSPHLNSPFLPSFHFLPSPLFFSHPIHTSPLVISFPLLSCPPQPVLSSPTSPSPVLSFVIICFDLAFPSSRSAGRHCKEKPKWLAVCTQPQELHHQQELLSPSLSECHDALYAVNDNRVIFNSSMHLKRGVSLSSPPATVILL